MNMHIDIDGDLIFEDSSTAFEHEGDICIDSTVLDEVLTFLLDKKDIFYDPALGFVLPDDDDHYLAVSVTNPAAFWFKGDTVALPTPFAPLHEAFLAAYPGVRPQPKPEVGEVWTFTTVSQVGEAVGQIRQAQGDDLAIRPVDRPGDFLIEGSITKLVKRLRDKDGNWVGGN